MPARTPEDCDRLVSEAISSGDIEAALDLYEPEAAFVSEPGTVVTGLDGIRHVMTQFMAMKPQLAVEADSVSCGDIALLRSRWTLKGTDPDGNPVDMSGIGAEVVRRQPDGTWRFIIDNPWAGG